MKSRNKGKNELIYETKIVTDVKNKPGDEGEERDKLKDDCFLIHHCLEGLILSMIVGKYFNKWTP